jgi:hypothetical protein
MKVVKIEDTSALQKYCDKCEKLGWINNSSLERLNNDMVIKNQGTYFGIYENGEIVSIAGIYKFHELYPDSWRIFYRSATLPNKARNKGLHRGTGLRGRLYINAFLNYTHNGSLYLTTNIELSNSNQNTITRYHKHMQKESSLKDSYVDYVDTLILYETKQAIWKLNNEKYYQRTQKHHL